MPLPYLLFRRHRNSYSVKVPNLESLQINQIKILQEFVESRNGLFDFESYSFSVQKRLEFQEFTSLIKHLGIDARIEEEIIYKESEPRIGFGQYKGMLFSELPDSYLKWLELNYRGSQREIILKEISKRV